MKHLIAILLLSVTTISIATGQDILRFKVSKPYCIINFMETTISANGTSSTLRQYIKDHIPTTETAFYDLVEAYQSIELSYTYNREEYPENRRSHRSTADLLFIAAVQSNTLEEFKARTIGILPNSEHYRLFDILAKAEPYYNRIIWEPSSKALNNHIKELNKYKTRANEVFERFKYFYNSSWTEDIPFIVAIYPIPGNKGNTTATPHANSLCVGMLTGEKDYAQRMAVVFHEMCHVLYDEQSAFLQHHLDKIFTGSKSPYSQYAYNYIDEGLATALGNGWSYKYITGKPDTTEWYNDPYIDGFGHQLYPLVDSYLQAHRMIDSNFVAQAIDLFGKRFPRSIHEFGILMNKVNLYCDGETSAERSKIMRPFREAFTMTSTNLSSPVLDPVSIDHLKNDPGTQVVILDRNIDETLPRLAEIFLQLKDVPARLAPGGDYLVNFIDDQQRPVMVLIARSRDGVANLVKFMTSVKYLEPTNLVRQAKP